MDSYYAVIHHLTRPAIIDDKPITSLSSWSVAPCPCTAQGGGTLDFLPEDSELGVQGERAEDCASQFQSVASNQT